MRRAAARCVALAAAAHVASATAGCGSGTITVPRGTNGVPAVRFFDPDVPAWRGGCFFAGDAGKIVNGSPSPDVRMFGKACAAPAGEGGLVYLDRYDPAAGTGDVTILLSRAGSRPVVVGRAGGAGGVIDGGTGARLDDGETKLLTLADVGFVTGTLQLVDLADPASAAPVASTATSVRVENYDFLPGGAVLYVNDYSASTRQGDLVYQQISPRGAPQTIATQASRFDFLMYRLAPDRRRVAYVDGLGAGGGRLLVQSLPPGPPPAAPIHEGVTSMEWTADGTRLVFLVQDPDGVTSDVWSWDPTTGTSTPLAQQAIATALSGADLLVATGWTVLDQQATLHLFSADAASIDRLAAAGVSRSFTAGRSAAGAALLAYAAVPASDPSTGDLFVAPLSPGSATPVHVEGGVSVDAGFAVSPGARFVTYAQGFEAPVASGSGNAQPGIARQLRFASAAGVPFALADAAAVEHVAWDPRAGEPHVAAISSFDPAADSGAIVVRITADGTLVAAQPLAPRVSARWFDFVDDGSALAFIGDWDAGLQRGALALAATSGAAAWQPQAVPGGEGATFFTSAQGRVVYGVRGDARDGLWLAPAAP